MKYNILKAQSGTKIPLSPRYKNYPKPKYQGEIKKDETSQLERSIDNLYRDKIKSTPIEGIIKTIIPSAAIASGAAAGPILTTARGVATAAGYGALQGLGFGQLGMGSGNALSDASYGVSGEFAGPLVGKVAGELFGKIGKGVKNYINRNIKNNLTSHVQGDEAIKMFKQYGGQDPIVENSPLMDRMRRYAPEARERYGIVGNTNITDEEIARSLYKQANSISQKGNQAVNSKGEPLVLFRGDTRRYENLRHPSSPEEVAKETWTMDNALGTLYLGDLPGPKGEGIDRYLVTQRFGGIEGLNSSATGSKYVVPKDIDRSMPLPGSRLLTQRNAPHGASDYLFKVPSKYVESGVNDINAFVVNSKGIRDATDEISVLFDDALSKKQSFKGIQNNNSRESIAKHYQNVLDDANSKNQGLLKSNKNSPLRDEHDYYDYYALPKFNHNNIKHILPYDMRIPRNLKDPNIYKSLIGGAFLNNLINNLKEEHMK